jgi:Zn-finger nucleic acid-binding protein
MKRCPRCLMILAEAQIGPVRVDGCGGCGGVWFDNAELGLAANTESTDLLALEDQFLPSTFSPRRQSQMACPTCHVALFEFEFAHSPGVRLDACPQCKGVWVDDGELKALYTRMAGVTSGGVSPGEDTRRAGRQALGLIVSRPCPRCGKPNSAAAQLCGACAHRLPPAGAQMCPNCDVLLNHVTFRGLSLDVCPDCTGAWLDAGELSALADCTPEELRQVQNDAAVKRQGVSVLWNANPSLMCPRCCVSLAAPALLYGADIPLDACLRCNGIWVGAGSMPAVSRHYRQSLGRRHPLS